MKRIIIYIFLFISITIKAQLSINEHAYSSFSSRNFVKFNQFLTVPTMSVLHKNNTSLSVLGRRTNMGFEGAPQLYLATFSGNVYENMGAGVAIYKQDVNIFSDFGAILNYAYQIQMYNESTLNFGFNFLYSSRGIATNNIISSTPDPALQNYQKNSTINLQPAITYSSNNFDIGILIENAVDYNIKKGEKVSEFKDKTISLHAMYKYDLWLRSYLFEDASLKFLSVVRKQSEGVGLGVNAVLDLPKLGWLKLTYDKDFGFLAGIGVNLSKSISLALGYELGKVANTAEAGIVYNLPERSNRRYRKPSVSKSRKPKVKKVKPSKPKVKKDTPVTKDKGTGKLPKEQPEPVIVRDTIRVVDTLRITVRDTLKIKKQIIVKDTLRIQKEVIDTLNVKGEFKDTSLKRRTNTPWREKTITREGGGGTMHYVAIDQFKDIKKVRALMKKYEKGKVRLRYIKDPKTNLYYVYLDRFGKKKDAEDLVAEINRGRRGFEDNKENDLGIKIKSVSKDPVYEIKLTIGGKKETFKEPKAQPPARVRTMRKMQGMEEGYYLQVMVFSKKAYADKFLDELRADNINVDYFINPETGYRHVYLVKTNDRQEIIKLYNSNLNGSYYDAKNIIHVR